MAERGQRSPSHEEVNAAAPHVMALTVNGHSVIDTPIPRVELFRPTNYEDPYNLKSESYDERTARERLLASCQVSTLEVNLLRHPTHADVVSQIWERLGHINGVRAYAIAPTGRRIGNVPTPVKILVYTEQMKHFPAQQAQVGARR